MNEAFAVHKLNEVGMVWQFAYDTDEGFITTGGLSALEDAFGALGWDDPYPMPEELICDQEGCRKRSTCGFPTETGYKRTCGAHYRSRNETK